MMTKLSIALAFAMLAAVAGAHAQTYPSRPVTVIVPFAAGGVTDIVARIVSERMKTALGQSVIIENVSGAGGTIGVTRLFRAAPDGYTLVVGQWTSHVGAGAMYPVPFDYLNDFEPVSMLSIAPLWIVGRSRSAGEGSAGADRLAQGQSRQGIGRHHRARQRHSHVPASISRT